jgi:hypothetical protein
MELLRHGLDVPDHGHGCANAQANGYANVCGVSHVCTYHVCANGCRDDGANCSSCANCTNDYDANDHANCCSCANCTTDLRDGLRPHSVAYHK